MKCKILSINHKSSDWERKALDFYLKQIPKIIKISFVEVKPFTPKGSSEEMVLSKESKELIKQINNDSYIILWDRIGEPISSIDFSALFKKKLNRAEDITFIIGGAHGVSKDIFTKADLVLSASSLTFPHRIFKILLMEQIFRASSIIKNHPYHR